MTVKITCPHCDQHIEAPCEVVSTVVSCPTCNQQFYVRPKPPPPKPAASPTAAPSQPTKHVEDYAADAICAGAKAGFKAAKFVAPIFGRIGAKIASRAAKATAKAAAPHVKNVSKGTIEIAKGAASLVSNWLNPTYTPEEIARQKRQERKERIATFWATFIILSLSGLTVWLATLPHIEEIATAIAGYALVGIVCLVVLVVIIGFIALMTNRTGQRIVYWLFFR